MVGNMLATLSLPNGVNLTGSLTQFNIAFEQIEFSGGGKIDSGSKPFTPILTLKAKSVLPFNEKAITEICSYAGAQATLMANGMPLDCWLDEIDCGLSGANEMAIEAYLVPSDAVVADMMNGTINIPEDD